MSGALLTLSVDEFVRRVRESSQLPEHRFAFFLGAGASASSGIPDAGTLVRDHWLPRLRSLRAPNRRDIEAWIQEELPGYRDERPELSYGATMDRLFLDRESRQLEIERLCEGRFPGFGYAVLAQLMAQRGGRFNAVLTTNFDHLLVDALYLYSQSRPLVVRPETDARYVRSSRTRPLVVKLYGDRRLAPGNSVGAKEERPFDISELVHKQLHDRGLIFAGYGGNDRSIVETLRALRPQALPYGVFWVSSREPDGVIRPWLEDRGAIWVPHGDFDELMLLFQETFGLPHPDPARLSQVFRRYEETFDALTRRRSTRPIASSEVERAARRDPARSDEIWRQALERSPRSASLRARYALHLWMERKSPEEAEEQFAIALGHDPHHIEALCQYARFLEESRDDLERAEGLYRRALSHGRKTATVLGLYARFLSRRDRDHARSLEYFRRALELQPGHPVLLTEHGDSLFRLSRFDEAETHLRRALELRPDDAHALAGLAGTLLASGQRPEGLEVLQRAMRILGQEPSRTAFRCWFYALLHLSRSRQAIVVPHLRRLFEAGVRPAFSDLRPNLSRARADAQPGVEWCEVLAETIRGRMPAELLASWPLWSGENAGDPAGSGPRQQGRPAGAAALEVHPRSTAAEGADPSALARAASGRRTITVNRGYLPESEQIAEESEKEALAHAGGSIPVSIAVSTTDAGSGSPFDDETGCELSPVGAGA